MTHIEILDLIAGLIFIYFLLSLMSNALFEAISALGNIRAKQLEKWLTSTFNTNANHFLNNELLDALSEKGKSTSYMKATDFATALLDLINKLTKADTNKLLLTSLDEVEAAVSKLDSNFPEKLKTALLIYVAKARAISTKATDDIEKEKERYQAFIQYTENWFDSMMERIGGVYKRIAMYWTFIIASIITLSVNVDSISVTKYLYSNKDATAKLAQAAYKSVNDSTTKNNVKRIEMIGLADTSETELTDTDPFQKIGQEVTKVKEINELLGTYIPIGWEGNEYDTFKAAQIKKGCKGGFLLILYFILTKLPGWAMTILAIMLGAPFWFDMLNRVANLRNSLKPLTSEEEKTKKEKALLSAQK